MATSKNEIAMEGPAGGRPCMRTAAVPPPRRKFTIISSTCACRIDGAWKYSPAAAVPVSTKMPDPMMAPMPSAVSDHGPSVFCRRWPGDSDSKISLSMDLQQKTCLSEVRITSAGSVDDGDKRLWSPEKPSLESFEIETLAPGRLPASLRDGAGESPAPTRVLLLPLRLAAGQFLHLGLFRSAGIIAGLERIFRLTFLAGGAFDFLAFFFA